MPDIKERFRRTEETGPISERATKKRRRMVAKYVFLTACGILLYRIGSDHAFAQRGYQAMGGEVIFLLVPLLYYAMASMLQDAIREVSAYLVDKEKTGLEDHSYHNPK